jgi:vacuolar-type H+-ATPase subunit F/Vma7
MTRSVRIVCRPEVAVGFALAGLPVVEASSPADGAARTLALAAAPDTGVVLVEDECYAALSEAERRSLERRPLPMIVSFPGPARGARAEADEEYLAEILRQAIGYRVRLR